MTDNYTPMQMVEQGFKQLTEDNAFLKEELSRVQAMFQVEDRGWTKLFGGLGEDDAPGMSLAQVKEWAAQIQEYIVGNPYIKRGSSLRSNYVWSKSINIPGSAPTGKRGQRSKLVDFCNHPKTKEYLLSAQANDEMERSAFATGAYLLIGNDSTGTIDHPVPITEVTNFMTNPDYSGEVWAYLREWDSMNPATGEKKLEKRWYYTDRVPKTDRRDSIKVGADNIKVDKSKTIFDVTFNSQVGWPLGIPDAVAAIVWARIYSEMVNHGKVMTESLAKFAFKVVQNTQQGAKNVGVKTSQGGAGQTGVVGANNDLVPLSSAGKTYDFQGLQAIIAAVATSLEVSVVHLTSDPGSAGSSYGSASNLDLPTKKSVITRQNLWESYIARILKWATGETVAVDFPPLDDDIYRAVQSLVLLWDTGTVHPDELRDSIVELGGILDKHGKAPEGILTPNNEKSQKEVGAHAISPDQGQQNGVGGAGADKNDKRTDKQSEGFGNAEFVDTMNKLVEQFNKTQE